MKKLLFILLITTLFSCSKDADTQVVKTTTTHMRGRYVVLNIGRSYISYDGQTRNNTILSSSHYGTVQSQKSCPELQLICTPSPSQVPGYPTYTDTIDVVSGDTVSVSIDLAARWDYGSSLGGVYVALIDGSVNHGKFMCTGDTLSQTISYTVQ